MEFKPVPETLLDSHLQHVEEGAALVGVLLRDAGKLREGPQELRPRSRGAVQAHAGKQPGERIGDVGREPVDDRLVAHGERAEILSRHEVELSRQIQVHRMVADIADLDHQIGCQLPLEIEVPADRVGIQRGRISKRKGPAEEGRQAQ